MSSKLIFLSLPSRHVTLLATSLKNVIQHGKIRQSTVAEATVAPAAAAAAAAAAMEGESFVKGVKM